MSSETRHLITKLMLRIDELEKHVTKLEKTKMDKPYIKKPIWLWDK